jgi:hypothetical protein
VVQRIHQFMLHLHLFLDLANAIIKVDRHWRLGDMLHMAWFKHLILREVQDDVILRL